MLLAPVVVCLPIADRRTSFAFYGEGLGSRPSASKLMTVYLNRCSSLSTTAAFASC